MDVIFGRSANLHQETWKPPESFVLSQHEEPIHILHQHGVCYGILYNGTQKLPTILFPWSQSMSILYAATVDTRPTQKRRLGKIEGIGDPKMHDSVSSSHNCASVLQRTNISLTAPQSFLYFNLLHRGKTYPYIVLHV